MHACWAHLKDLLSHLESDERDHIDAATQNLVMLPVVNKNLHGKKNELVNTESFPISRMIGSR